MEWLNSDIINFLSRLFAIIFIDLVLAGDNAIVIGMAARNLPKEQQKKVILLGTSGAVLIRIAATVLVVWLLQVPWLLLIGGVLLIWIAYKLLISNDQHDVKAGQSIWEAVRTIIIADAAMGVDNVIAIAGTAQGDIILVVLGLLISVPIIVWGSTLFIKLIQRFPIILYFGAGILAFTAANMITNEKMIEPMFNSYPWLRWLVISLIIVVVIAAGRWTLRLRAKQNQNSESISSSV